MIVADGTEITYVFCLMN